MKRLLSKAVAMLLSAVLLLALVGSPAIAQEAPTTIRFARAGNVQDPEVDRILLALQAKLNIKLEIVSIPWDQFPNKLNIMVSTGEPLDFVLCDAGSMVESWANDGLIIAWDEMLATGNYPLVNSLVNSQMYKNFKINGQVYYKPLPLVPNQRGMLIRTDWLQNVGLEMPTNLDEFYTVLKAFVENDPDGNGVDDTLGIWDYFSLPYVERCFAINAPNMGPNSSDAVWVEQADGTVTRYEISDQNLASLTFLRKLYQEGLLKKDFITTKVDSDIGYANFSAGKYGVEDSSNPQLAYETLIAMNPDATVALMPALEGVNGVPANSGNNGGSWWGAAITSTCENPEKVMELFEYCLTAEGRELTEFGIEGIHFTSKETVNGATVYTMDREECAKDWDVESNGLMYPLTWGAFNYGENFYIPIEKYDYDFDTAYQNMETWINMDLAGGQFATWAADIAKYSIASPLLNVNSSALQGDTGALKSVYDQYRLKIIMDENVDVEAEFAQMKAEWLSVGGQAVIDAGNEYWAANK